MPYTKTTWKDRLVQYEKRYTVTDNGDGTVTIDQSPGTITEAGTPISAANMNKIEQGIADAHTKLDAATSAATPNTLVQRDANGRFKAAAPAASDDVARKAETDAALAVANAALPRRIFTSGTYDFNNRGDGSFIEEVKSNASITFQNGPPGATSGTLIQGEGSHNKWQMQFYMMQGDNRKMFFRTSVDASGTKEWRDWVELITSVGGQTFNASMTISSTLPALRLFDTDSNNSVWLLHDNNSFYLQLRDASGNWVRDLMRISDGAAVAFFTSLRIVDDNMRMYRSADNELVIDNKVWNTIIGSYNNVYLAANCFFEGGQWRRYDSSKGASLLVANASTKSIEFRTANAGTGNISWQVDTVWHTGQLRNNNGVLELYHGGVWTPVGGIKSVQRGSTSTYVDNSDPENPVSVTQIDVPITPVNTNKAFVVITSTWSRDGDGSGGKTYQAHAQLLNSSTVRVNATLTGVTVHWQVVEFY